MRPTARLLHLPALAVALVPAAPAVAAAATAATVEAVEMPAWVEGGAGERVPARPGAVLEAADHVRTGSGHVCTCAWVSRR